MLESEITDTILAEVGFEYINKGRILLIACGALAREIIHLIEINHWSHIDLQCLPAILHNDPKKIIPAVKKAVQKYKPEYSKIFVVYADCGTGGQLQKLCEQLGVFMIEGPHCYSFFEGNKAFAAREEITCFYLTDFLVRQFDAFFWKPMGLDRHEQLRDIYFRNYTTLVYQAQTKNKSLEQKAKAYADQMGLQYEYRYTGYGDLEFALTKVASFT